MKLGSGRSYYGLVWGLAIVGTVLDQATKYGVFKWLYDERWIPNHDGHQNKYEIVSGWFQLLTQFTGTLDDKTSVLSPLRTASGALLPKVNQGALFGFLREHGEVANALFALVSIIAVIAIVYWSRRPSTTRDISLCAALGLILAGTLGNLYDRIVFDGVRDFLYFYWINWPVFNVADCCLVVGASLLLAQAFWNRQHSPDHEIRLRVMSSEVAQVK